MHDMSLSYEPKPQISTEAPAPPTGRGVGVESGLVRVLGLPGQVATHWVVYGNRDVSSRSRTLPLPWRWPRLAAFEARVFAALCSVLHAANVPLPSSCKETGDGRRACPHGPGHLLISRPLICLCVSGHTHRPRGSGRAQFWELFFIPLQTGCRNRAAKRASCGAQASSTSGPRRWQGRRVQPSWRQECFPVTLQASRGGGWAGSGAPVSPGRGFLTATSSRGSHERGSGGSCPVCSPSGRRPLWLGSWRHIRKHPGGQEGCAGGGGGAGGGLGFSGGLRVSVGRLTLRHRDNAGVFSSLSCGYAAAGNGCALWWAGWELQARRRAAGAAGTRGAGCGGPGAVGWGAGAERSPWPRGKECGGENCPCLEDADPHGG